MSNNAVDCRLVRHQSGILVRIKVIPEIEEFFRQWGGGTAEGPAYGRLWKPLRTDEPLRFWSYEAKLEEGANYSLNRTGALLFDDYNGTGINISFLRMVGASQGDGCAFMAEVVMSTEEMKRAAYEVVKAGEQFYHNYIRPVNIHCYVGVVDYSKAGPLFEKDTNGA